MRNFEVFAYKNVTKNENDFWVADKVPTGKFIQIDDEAKPKEVCNSLVDVDILESSNMRTLLVTDLSKDIIEVKAKKGSEPICRLQRRS